MKNEKVRDAISMKKVIKYLRIPVSGQEEHRAQGKMTQCESTTGFYPL